MTSLLTIGFSRFPIGNWWKLALPPISYWWSFGTESLSPALFEILGSTHIGVTTLTFQGHVITCDLCLSPSAIGHVTIRFSIGHFLFASSDSFLVRCAV